jgi:hypothetical protein
MHPRRFATLVAALALGVLALPSAAKAEQFCYGDIAAIEATPERDTGVTYEFTCREPGEGVRRHDVGQAQRVRRRR